MNTLQIFLLFLVPHSEDQINTELALAENCTEIDPGEPIEDHGDPPLFGEVDTVNELLALCDHID